MSAFFESLVHYECPHCKRYNTANDRVFRQRWVCPDCAQLVEETELPIARFNLIDDDKIDDHIAKVVAVLLAAKTRKMKGEK